MTTADDRHGRRGRCGRGSGCRAGASICSLITRSRSWRATRRNCGTSPTRSWRRGRGRSRSRSTSAKRTQSARPSSGRSRELGDVDVLLYNAAMRPFGRSTETKPSTFENTWRVNAFGAFLCAQAAGAGDAAQGTWRHHLHRCDGGSRPFATSAAFGPAKFALRGLAQVMARDPGRRACTSPTSTSTAPSTCRSSDKLRPDLKPEDMLAPAAIAETFWHVAHQDRSAWTQELDLRPFKEQF